MGVTTKTPDPDFVDKWKQVKARIPFEDQPEDEEDPSFDEPADEKQIEAFFESLDNDMFAGVMKFLTDEGYVVVQPEDAEVRNFLEENGCKTTPLKDLECEVVDFPTAGTSAEDD
ncbi:hypothetical protein [Leisingera sp. ANG-M1]|uniref:hypothetical protein n=1 Tax=Leisingera sp. ANG-M1 TaxID=1577895 RepID=UPI001269A273|nr:hypothetical protein [Leisingera sp. ANG-M1]